MSSHLVVVLEGGVAVAHAAPHDGVVLSTESHRAAQSTPVLGYDMPGSLEHLE